MLGGELYDPLDPQLSAAPRRLPNLSTIQPSVRAFTMLDSLIADSRRDKNRVEDGLR
jgi:hypothetical protein